MPSSKRRRSPDPGDICYRHENEIRKLYQTQGRSIEEVKNIMEQEWGFPIMALPTWVEKIGNLGIRKNTKEEEWGKIYRYTAYHRLEDPRRRKGDLKLKRTKRKTEVLLQDRKYTWDQAWKNMKSAGVVGRPVPPDPPSPLPPWIIIRTPPPSPPLSLSPRRVFSQGISLPARAGYSQPVDPMIFQKEQLMLPAQATLRRQDTTSRGARSPFNYLLRESTPGESLAQNELKVSEVLQDTPICAVIQKLRDISKPTEPPVNDIRGGVTSALPSQYTFVNECYGGQSAAFNLTHLARRLLPTTLERLWAIERTTTAGYHSAWVALSVVIYLFSNNLAWKGSRTRSTYAVPDALFDSLDSILVAIPERQLQSLLHSRLASIRGAWEGMLMEAGRRKQQRPFTTLVQFGLRNGWIAQAASESGHVYLLYAASMDLRDLLQKLLDAGCRADGPLHHISRAYPDPTGSAGRPMSAITEALQSGYVESAELLLKYCDINRRFKLKARPDFECNNTQVLMDRLAHCGDCETSCGRGFELFVKSGLQVDDLVDWPLWKRSMMSPLDRMDVFYKKWNWKNKKRYWPTILDYLFYFHRPLFDKFAQRSAALASHITRAGVLTSLEGGKDKFNEYLSTRTLTKDGTRVRRFLELVLAEQFAMRDVRGNARRLDIKAARALLCLSGDFGVSIDKKIATFMMSEVVLRVPQCGLEAGIEAIYLLFDAGATVASDTLKHAVIVRDNDLLELLAGRATQDLLVVGATALAEALRRHDLEAAEILIRYGVDINAEIRTPKTVRYATSTRVSILAWAVSTYNPRPLPATEESQLDMVQFMIHRGAHFQMSAYQQHPFHLLEFWLRSWKSRVSPLRMIQYAFNGSNIRYLWDGHNSSTSLLDACAYPTNDIPWHVLRRVFKYLLAKGADVRHGTPLAAWICMGGGEELVLEMLAAGADINAIGHRRCHLRNALQEAAERCDPEMVLLLVENGANVNEPARGRQGGGCTALQTACRPFSLHDPSAKQQLGTIKILLENGADVNAPPSYEFGHTALGWAARSGNLEVAMLLLAHGADVNAPLGRHTRPENALDAAAYCGRMDMVKLLLDANALSARDRGGTGYDGAIRMAENSGHLAIADVLRQHILDNKRRGISNQCLKDPPRTWCEYIPAWRATGDWPPYQLSLRDSELESSSSASWTEDPNVDSENESLEDSHQGEAPFGDMTPGQLVAHDWVSSMTADITRGGREHRNGEVPNHLTYDVEPVTFAQDAGLYNHLDVNMDLDGDDFSGQTVFGGPDLLIFMWDDGLEASAPSWQPHREWWQDTKDRVVEVEED